jgi:hypothetical protein
VRRREESGLNLVVDWISVLEIGIMAKSGSRSMVVDTCMYVCMYVCIDVYYNSMFGLQ